MPLAYRLKVRDEEGGLFDLLFAAGRRLAVDSQRKRSTMAGPSTFWLWPPRHAAFLQLHGPHASMSRLRPHRPRLIAIRLCPHRPRPITVRLCAHRPRPVAVRLRPHRPRPVAVRLAVILSRLAAEAKLPVAARCCSAPEGPEAHARRPRLCLHAYGWEEQYGTAWRCDRELHTYCTSPQKRSVLRKSRTYVREHDPLSHMYTSPIGGSGGGRDPG